MANLYRGFGDIYRKIYVSILLNYISLGNSAAKIYVGFLFRFVFFSPYSLFVVLRKQK